MGEGSEFLDGLGLDLPNALSGKAHLLRDVALRVFRRIQVKPNPHDVALPLVEVADDLLKFLNYFVGQVVGSMKHIRPARRVIEEMAQEYADTMERLDAWAEANND